MPKEFSRTLRVGEQIQRQLATIIQHEMKDPRLSGIVTIADVEVSRDLSHARVYVSLLGSDEEIESSLAALHRAAGFLRSELSHRLSLRVTPALRFIHDKTTEQGNRIDALIRSAAREQNS